MGGSLDTEGCNEGSCDIEGDNEGSIETDGEGDRASMDIDSDKDVLLLFCLPRLVCSLCLLLCLPRDLFRSFLRAFS